MTLRKRILSLISLSLLMSGVVGAVFTYMHAHKKVAIEMEAALAVAKGAVHEAVQPLVKATEPARQLQRIISSFNGDRHLQALWIGPTGSVVTESRVLEPAVAVPEWFFRIFSGETLTGYIQLPTKVADMGYIRLATDSHNEVGEVWEDLSLKLLIVLAFSGLVLWLVHSALGLALEPLANLSAALNRVGHGDYEANVPTTGPLEFSNIYLAFNAMAGRLLEMERQNARLHEQLMKVQEEERKDIARDLHDEFGPFLFAIDVDARSIRNTHSRGGGAEIGSGADSIRASVAHLQGHLRSMLGRLRPAALLDLGLEHALDHLVDFWAMRQPATAVRLQIAETTFGEHLDTICYRVVQESLNNAMRHGGPSKISVAVKSNGPAVEIIVSDNGTGAEANRSKGFGLVGMRERVTAAGGTLSAGNRPTGGFEVRVSLPLDAADLNRPGDEAEELKFNDEVESHDSLAS